MPTTTQTSHDLESNISKLRAQLDQAVTQLVLNHFPKGIINPYEGSTPGRVCLQWENSDRSLETVITNGADVWITADLPELEIDALIDAALGVDAHRYESPHTRSGHTGTITEAYTDRMIFMDHEDGTPARHHVVRAGDGTARASLDRIPLDSTLLALATLPGFLGISRVTATR
ncbi:hypothetical protein [Kitasatospora sp. NPDC059327]|uniref:hypothetical protein n=1 Tax=Kitasatospora sp. NPDC059327 TaxID=3346803 RepID=UPI00367A9C47